MKFVFRTSFLCCYNDFWRCIFHRWFIRRTFSVVDSCLVDLMTGIWRSKIYWEGRLCRCVSITILFYELLLSCYCTSEELKLRLVNTSLDIFVPLRTLLLLLHYPRVLLLWCPVTQQQDEPDRQNFLLKRGPAHLSLAPIVITSQEETGPLLSSQGLHVPRTA